MKLRLLLLLALLPLLAACAVAAAPQNPTNPTTLEFTVSADDTALDHGILIVTRYDLEIVNAAGGIVVTQSLGKPTPVAGVATFNGLAPLLTALPPGTYTARVAAVGPGGTTRSLPSSPFAVAVRAPGAPGSVVIR